MPYRYVAYTQTGERIQGTVDAASEEMAEEALWQADYIIVSLKPVRPRAGLAELMPTFFGVKPRDLIVFSRQLATLIESGITILSALQMLQEQVGNKALKKALQRIIGDVQEGGSLSEALSKHPQVFPSIYTRMIRVGERMGNVEAVLRQLATYMEKREALTRRLRGAMAYPAFILVMAIGVVFIMMTFTLPAVMGLLREFGGELPTATRVLIAITDFTTTHRFHIVAAVLSAVTLAYLYTRTPVGRRQRDLLLLKIPVVGSINVQSNISRLCYTMSILLRAGLPVSEIMNLIVETTDNVILWGALERVRAEMLQGRGLSQPISEEEVFPGLLAQMIRVGEETGALDSNLETLAGLYEEEADRRISALTGMLEPALILLVGALVGFLAISVILPIYSLLGAMR